MLSQRTIFVWIWERGSFLRGEKAFSDKCVLSQRRGGFLRKAGLSQRGRVFSEKKIFSDRRGFLRENGALSEKNWFSQRKSGFLREKMVFLEKKGYLTEKRIFSEKGNFLREKGAFSENIFLRGSVAFSGKKGFHREERFSQWMCSCSAPMQQTAHNLKI